MSTEVPPVSLSLVLPAFAALLGACLGSFLNVCILRWGAEPKQSVVRPPSRCPKCGRGLPWYDNVPVVSWLVLRGRCRGCGEPISIQYPLVELATAVIWGYFAWRHDASSGPAAVGAVDRARYHATTRLEGRHLFVRLAGH